MSDSPYRICIPMHAEAPLQAHALVFRETDEQRLLWGCGYATQAGLVTRVAADYYKGQLQRVKASYFMRVLQEGEWVPYNIQATYERMQWTSDPTKRVLEQVELDLGRFNGSTSAMTLAQFSDCPLPERVFAEDGGFNMTLRVQENNRLHTLHNRTIHIPADLSKEPPTFH